MFFMYLRFVKLEFSKPAGCGFFRSKAWESFQDKNRDKNIRPKAISLILWKFGDYEEAQHTCMHVQQHANW